MKLFLALSNFMKNQSNKYELRKISELSFTSYYITNFGVLSVHLELVKWLDLTHDHHRSQAKETG